MQEQGTNKINCNKCKYFYITWEKEFPYGCKAMGFKSKNMPNRVTREVSQRQCLSFEPKDEPRYGQQKIEQESRESREGAQEKHGQRF